MRKNQGRAPIVLIVLVALIGISFLGYLARVVFYPVEQATRVYEKTLDADNVIYNYEWFRSQWQEVQAMDRKIATAQDAVLRFEEDAGSRAGWDFRDKEEHARLNTNLVGAQNVRNDMVATYNARAQMANRSIFMGRDVPSHIDQ